MYGLLLDSIQKFIVEKYGDHYWIALRQKCHLQNHWFMTHEVYSDSVMTSLIDHAEDVLGINRDQVMQLFGQYFAQNIGRYGYARLLRVLGRDLRDFLNGLDDLHEYLKFSYPKMRAPSFACEQETPSGLIMHYTTKRRGYLPYVIGQLTAVGKIYGKDLEIVVEHEQSREDGCHVVLRLNFDNHEMLQQKDLKIEHPLLEISGNDFLSIFPFMLSFDSSMTIIHVGAKLNETVPGLLGQKLTEVFLPQRPSNLSFSYEMILRHTNCTFELVSLVSVHRSCELALRSSTLSDREILASIPKLTLKGQMKILHGGEMVVFLCSPVMNSPEDLYQSGIFISDLAMYDCGRDFILAGSQQSPELSLALSQEKIRSQQLEESIQKTDQLLYQMIPKPIADKLRRGDSPVTTCKEMDNVSVLFSDIVKFTPMCARLKPMQAVSILNTMYVKFDALCEMHHVYKVQTIGDGYMAVSGTPIETPYHAEYITNFAFSLLEAVTSIMDPSTNKPIQIRIGIHSGPVVVGVVGSSFLRYDVLGDTVNTAARMEATGMPLRIHVSEATAKLLEGTNYVLEDRGEVEVKGKGLMKTFWVIQRIPDSTTDHLNPLQRNQYDLRRRSTAVGEMMNNGQSSRNRFHSVPNVSGFNHGRPLLPLPGYAASIFTPMESGSNSVGNGNMHNLATGSSRTSRTPPYLQGIRSSLTPGPDEWPEAEQALRSPEDFSSLKDLDSPNTLSGAVQIVQRHETIDLDQLQLELASLKLSNSPNLAKLAHHLLTHAKETETVANTLLQMIQADSSSDSQEPYSHEEVPIASPFQPSHTAEMSFSPRGKQLTTLPPIEECSTKEANKLQSSIDVGDKRTASKSMTPLEETSASHHVGNHQPDTPARVHKLTTFPLAHQSGVYTGGGGNFTNPLLKEQQGSENGAGMSVKKSSGNQPSTDITMGQRYRGTHSSVDKDDENGQSGCNIM